MGGSKLRILLVHPGASWSTADVESGLRHGLQHHGVEIIRFQLDSRLERSKSWLYASWRKAQKNSTETIQRPTVADVVYHAGIGALERALRHQVDAVLVVSAMLLHKDVLILMRRAGLRVFVLFTETPYDLQKELQVAAMVDGIWTNERSSVGDFKAVNPNSGYLPHAWHPGKHFIAGRKLGEFEAHDVVFVGSGFSERIAWFNAIDWTGINLGLYGTWKGLGLKREVMDCVRAEQIENAAAASLYRRAKVGLNLYRSSMGFGRMAPRISHAESLSPRAYELAACGSFHISDARAEVAEKFGPLVPTFTTPQEAEQLIREWLPKDAERQAVAEQLPACVAADSWVERAATVIGDLQSLKVACAA
jgi:hypothetical protein